MNNTIRNNNYNPLVSIIVPIFNVEKYLDKCISSLLCQDYQNIEIILVNDGSPDNCSEIIEKYKKIDNRIIPLHKQNEGVSSARNDGYKISSGDYIMFVDGDDYVEKDYVSYFVSLIVNNECDIVVGDSFLVNDEKNTSNSDCSYNIYEPSYVIENIYLQRIGVGVWNKIYKRSIIDRYNLRFNTKFWFAEGMLFNIMYLQYIQKAIVCNKKTYHIVENSNSATRLFNVNSFLCGLRSMEYQRDHWRLINQRIQISWEYHYRLYAESILEGLIKEGNISSHYELYKKCIRVLKKNIRIPLQANVSIYKKMKYACMRIDPVIYIKKISKFSDCHSILKKIKLFQIKLYQKIPFKFKLKLYNHLFKKYNKKYKPVYLRSHYFESCHCDLDNL